MRTLLFSFSFLIFSFLFSCSSRDPKTDSIKPGLILDSLSLADDALVRGRQFYEADQLDSALYWYERSISYNPDSKHAWHGGAVTLGRLGRHEESMPAYEEAIRLDSNYVGAIWHRACGYSIMLEKDKALDDLRRAIVLDSTIKQGAQEDLCFEWLWEDKDFLAVVK